jgi:hypothetical protein
MRVLAEVRIDGAESLTTVAADEDGRRAAFVADDRTIHVFAIGENGGLAPLSVAELPTAPSGGDGKPVLTDARAVFVGDDSLLVGRQVNITNLQLALLDPATGAVTADAYLPSQMICPETAAPVVLPMGRHVLYPILENVLCLEVPSLREVFRIRAYDEEGYVLGEGEDISGEEQVTGLVYDPATSLLHVQWSVFNSWALQGYRIDAGAGTCAIDYRRAEVGDDEGAGLCPLPDGAGLAATAKTLDSHLLTGDPAPEEDEPAPGLRAPFGRVWLLGDGDGGGSDEAPEPLPLLAELRRDFSVVGHYRYPPEGGAVHVGWRFSAEHLAGAPFFVDDQTLVAGLPSGALLGLDTGSGETAVLHDLGRPLNALTYHAPTRRLFAACGDGHAVVLAT